MNHALQSIPPVLGAWRGAAGPAPNGCFRLVPTSRLAASGGAHRLGLAFNEDHYLFFTPATLDRLLRAAGFTIMGLSTPRWIDFQRGPAATYPGPFRAVNGLVERLRLGLEIFALARVV